MNQQPSTRKTSILARLRGLVPNRPLHYGEALRISELQAMRLRSQLGITSPELPEDAISSIPRIRVMEIEDLPSSGASPWHNGVWIIATNAREPWQRQRFSRAHELWHIINFRTEQWLCVPDSYRSAVTKRERLAEYFAGCLLMPKQHLKRLVGEGCTPADLADIFGVSERAVEVRLSLVNCESIHLGRGATGLQLFGRCAASGATSVIHPNQRRWQREPHPIIGKLGWTEGDR